MQPDAWKSWLSAYLAFGICTLIAWYTGIFPYVKENWLGRIEFSPEWISMMSLTWTFNFIGFTLFWPRGINTRKRELNWLCVAGMAIPHSLMDMLMLLISTRLSHALLHTEISTQFLNIYVWPSALAFLIYSVLSGPFYALFWNEQVVPIEYDVWKLVVIEMPSALLFTIQLIVYNNILLVWLIALMNYTVMYAAMRFPSPWYREAKYESVNADLKKPAVV